MQELIEILAFNPDKPLLFNSGLFLLLFTAFYAVYIALKARRIVRVAWTICFSLFFYYKCSGDVFVILIASTLVDYFVGIWIYNSKSILRRRLFLALSLFFNLGLLAYFKYTNFFLTIANDSFGGEFGLMDIALPVGISFYTFQTLSYSIDIYRKELEPCRNLLDFGFYVTFFPQLVAGPIVRAKDFIPQIYSEIKTTIEAVNRGWWLIICGLFKKAVISDYISVNFVDRVFDNPYLYSGFENLMAVYGYAIQIYCDFSGYSDMAIGLALLLGFSIPDNFRTPYKATSIRDFWRRWHISLSSWLRDYLYIPLGGSKHGEVRTYLALMGTMLLGGLWHGAAWKFVLWGALHGAALAVERFMSKFVKWPSGRVGTGIAWLLTFHFVCFCWIYFRADSRVLAEAVMEQIVGFSAWDHAFEIMKGYWEVFVMLSLGLFVLFMPDYFKEQAKLIFYRLPMVLKALVIAACFWLAFTMASSEVQPFIYFQF